MGLCIPLCHCQVSLLIVLLTKESIRFIEYHMETAVYSHVTGVP